MRIYKIVSVSYLGLVQALNDFKHKMANQNFKMVESWVNILRFYEFPGKINAIIGTQTLILQDSNLNLSSEGYLPVHKSH